MNVWKKLTKLGDELACVHDLGLVCPDRCSLKNTVKCPNVKPEQVSIVVPGCGEKSEITVAHAKANVPSN